jgi:VanZ family protein
MFALEENRRWTLVPPHLVFFFSNNKQKGTDGVIKKQNILIEFSTTNIIFIISNQPNQNGYGSLPVIQ